MPDKGFSLNASFLFRYYSNPFMSSTIKKILILAANPKNSTPLRLDQEVRGN